MPQYYKARFFNFGSMIHFITDKCRSEGLGRLSICLEEREQGNSKADGRAGIGLDLKLLRCEKET